jgi:hypothetical protein
MKISRCSPDMRVTLHVCREVRGLGDMIGLRMVKRKVTIPQVFALSGCYARRKVVTDVSGQLNEPNPVPCSRVKQVWTA